jgi:hypothetical protein
MRDSLRANSKRNLWAQTPSKVPLRHPEAEGISGEEAWGSGIGGTIEWASASGGCFQALHGSRYGPWLGCGGGLSQCYGKKTWQIPGNTGEASPFPVRAIQVDGGNEFVVQFELTCTDKGIRLFVLPLRSSKWNGRVERAQRTHIGEFHDLTMGDFDLEGANEAMLDWEHFNNTVNIHDSLDLKTPAEYLRGNRSGLASID